MVVSGLCPFNEKPKYQPHIQATKGKSVKKNTLNYDALGHSKPMHPQLMEQIGKGNRLTTGKICGIPLTDEHNLLLFEALDREKAIVARGKAAQERKKAKKSRLGDDELIQNWADYKMEEMKLKVAAARERESRGVITLADRKVLNSRLCKQFEAAAQKRIPENVNPLPPAPIRVMVTAPIPPTPKPRSKTKPHSKKKKRKNDDDKED
jgi:hypothetical protein